MTASDVPWRREEVLAYFSRSRSERRKLLERKVLDAIDNAWLANPFYGQLWRDAGVVRRDFTRFEDLQLLPTCSAADFRQSIEATPPYGAYYSNDRVRNVSLVLATGGTTGAPRPILVTQDDEVALGRAAARVWNWIGVGAGDTVQVVAPFSLHGAAWVAKWGLRRVGARLIPSGGGGTTATVQQIELMRQFKPSAILALPNYLGILAEAAKKRGVTPASLGIKRILVGAEVLTPSLRRDIEASWQANVYDVYGTVDTLVWSSVDCEANREAGGDLGSHLWTDEIVAEILDEKGDPCGPGEYGELTFTSWLCGVAPRFRFRTGDRAAITPEPCPCGLDTPRMLPIKGRLDDRIRFHGVSMWPSSIDEVFHRAISESREYVVVASSDSHGESLTIQIEAEPRDDVYQAVIEEFRAAFGVRVVPQFVAQGATSELTGRGRSLKVRRVIDRRGGSK